ncbi:MAG: cytochrome c, partial [Bacteroidetes bacterium]|nr:cytochrome c [Bacteroidota bacterium]
MKLSSNYWIYSLILISYLGLGCSSQNQKNPAYSTDKEVIAQGNEIFDNTCVACHNFRTTGIGPNLAGVTREVPEQWLKDFIRNPVEVIQSGDRRGQELFEQYKQYMPPYQHLTDEELDAVLAYIHTRKERPDTPTRTEWGELVLNPIVPKIQPSGLTLTLKEFAQLPPTEPKGQQARVNKIFPIGNGNQRLFAHDLRGKLYEIEEGKSHLFLDLAAMKPAFMHTPGHGTGMGSFAFHPEYDHNGLFYTTHTEQPEKSDPADFSFSDTLPRKVRYVLTEWKQNDPQSSEFEGTQREIFRIDMVTQIHGVQNIAFNPLAEEGDED